MEFKNPDSIVGRWGWFYMNGEEHNAIPGILYQYRSDCVFPNIQKTNQGLTAYSCFQIAHPVYGVTISKPKQTWK